MRKIKLDNHRGLPMYFIRERIKGMDFKINFSDTKEAQVGDELELRDFIYRVDEITEQRLSPLEYGVSVPVFFQSTRSKLIRKIVTEKENGQQVKKEISVLEPAA